MCGLFGTDATSVLWSVELDADLFRLDGASMVSLVGLLPLRLQYHIPRPINSMMKPTTPALTPIAAGVLIFVVGSRLESPPGPNGAACARPAHMPPEHVVSLSQSPPTEQVAPGTSDREVAFGLSSEM